MPATRDPASWPEGVLFWPTWQIPYQTEYIARMFLMGGAELAADMGTGKSIMALGVCGLCVEESAVDRILVVCEPNKLKEWRDDFARFTKIDAAIYHGPKRKTMLDALPTALVTTYETCRDDAAVFPPKGSRSRTITPGPLTDALRGQRVLVVYDESTKLAHRTSKLYKAHYWFTGQLRKHAETRVIGMSGTPMEKDLEDIFNQLRLVVPGAMPTVAEFERRVVSSRHPVYRTPSYHPNGKEWFRQLCEPWILRKRKSDPDVRDMFPPFIEEFRRILMRPDQYRLYQLLEDLAYDPKTKEFQPVPGLNVLLRQLAGDPLAVLETARTGTSPLAKVVADELGPELEKCSSAKAAQLTEDVDLAFAAGGKVMVFTFFGQTVLPVLARRLAGRPVFTYHGQMTPAAQEEQKALFKAYPGSAVLLSSDSGARGINVPEASYIIEYDIASKHSLRQQRAARGHRLGHMDPLTFISYVLESSIEYENSVKSLLARNRDQDFILGDDVAEGHFTADDRRDLFAQARPRKAA